MSEHSHHSLRHLAKIESLIEYNFQDKSILIVALTHSSFGDGRRKTNNNERLEFLGDRVLGLLTAEHLYNMGDADEGNMAQSLNALVRKETCARVARSINLGEVLFISPSEIKQGGRDKTSILGDACEALLAAIYLDGGYGMVKEFYDRFWACEIDKTTAKRSVKDPKTVLQEKAYSLGGIPPVYTVIEQSGPDHRPLFVVEVDVGQFGLARGTGKSKKDAERFAAIHILEHWPETLVPQTAALTESKS